jgi:hypothetical protein
MLIAKKKEKENQKIKKSLWKIFTTLRLLLYLTSNKVVTRSVIAIALDQDINRPSYSYNFKTGIPPSVTLFNF